MITPSAVVEGGSGSGPSNRAARVRTARAPKQRIRMALRSRSFPAHHGTPERIVRREPMTAIPPKEESSPRRFAGLPALWRAFPRSREAVDALASIPIGSPASPSPREHPHRLASMPSASRSCRVSRQHAPRLAIMPRGLAACRERRQAQEWPMLLVFCTPGWIRMAVAPKAGGGLVSRSRRGSS